MDQRRRGLFAGGGIHLPSAKVTALTILVAFVVGILIGWLTTLVPDVIRAANASPSPSPSPSPAHTADPSVSIPPIVPITRDLDDEDRIAGLLSLDIPLEASGTFNLVAGGTEPDTDGPPVRWVSIEIEDGLEVSERLFSTFVMDVLNHPRAWGANNRLQYARTDGVADIRIVLASPFTAAVMCPSPHQAAPDRATIEEELDTGPAVTPTPGASASPAELSCAERSITVVSAHDWAAGLESYGEERQRSRAYLLMHGVGHLMGVEDEECKKGRAEVMVDQRELPDDCEPNPWPFPDAEIPDSESGVDPDGDG
jgi:hypothetical protein